MDQMTIGKVSSMFQISARMLRYYEKIGLIESMRKEGYAYRVYNTDAVRRVQQIIILRKLQIPLKQIRCMMEGNKEEAIRILEARIRDMNENVKTVHAMKKALEKLLELLYEDASDENYMDFVKEDTIVELTEFLPLEKHHLKGERKMSIAKEMVEKGNCVRIVLLPPCTVASYQFAGEDPEETVGEVMDMFIRSSRLYEIKPDARLFGFNNPEPQPGSDYHGYEDWVTIPDNMEVSAPLMKKHFAGGLYAAYTINFPDFYEWNFLKEWVKNSEKYQEDYRDYMEEHLNWVYSSHMGWPENGIDGKIDLLLPIKPR
ncbi:MAG: effector binding domain-containing protein [Lachnospiraceae bacterium]|nr:effector binding domain-containing protein [Lachnospiraceae bacterium]